MKDVRRSLSLLLVVAFIFYCAPLWSAKGDLPDPSPADISVPVSAKPDEPGRYIIKFKASPLALYTGGVGKLKATRALSTGRTRFNSHSAASVAYGNYLRQRRSAIRGRMESAIGRAFSFSHTYSIVFNGAVATLSADEAEKLRRIAGVVRVQPDTLQYIHTDAGPAWIGASDLWTGVSGSCGEGIVIGVIDSGITPENPSFYEIGDDGYTHTNPRGRYYGVCDPANADYDPSFPCNAKLIGAYDFTPLVPEVDNIETPWDVDGHGSHVAGTAAGNRISDAELIAPTTTITRNISGVAPHANIISYRTIRSTGSAYTSVLVAAIEQAVINGVDIINYSIGRDAANPWGNATSEAFLAARQAGVFVATSAGNDGPEFGSLGSPGNAPWLLTVGASTHDRQLTNVLADLTRDGGSGLTDISGKSITEGYGPASIVYAGDYPNPNDEVGDDAGQCLAPYPAGTFNGEIVVCDRGENARVTKGEHVLAGGAGGYVLANDEANTDSVNADAHALPAIHITYADGVALKEWLATGSNHMGTIVGSSIDIDSLYGDILASFSSRGENTKLPDIIKPDVTAPGVDILAPGGMQGEVKYEVMSGTSMSSPHAAGAAALLMSRHPDWTPAEIQSALTSSSLLSVLKEDAVSPADPFDMGAGRIDLVAADRVGVVLDESYEDFVAADPAAGGEPETLNLATLGQDSCVYSSAWTRVLRSVADVAVAWTASVVNPPDVTLTVEPAVFTMAPGATQTLTIQAAAAGASIGQWHFGQVLLTPDVATISAQHFPVAVKTITSNFAEREVHITDASTAGTQIAADLKSALAITTLTTTFSGLAPAEVFQGNLYQDPTPGDYLDSDDWLPEDGVFRNRRYISDPLSRLVYQLKDTNSPDLDMYVWYYDSDWHRLYKNARANSDNLYFSINNPAAGWYDIYLQNHTASDPDGAVADTFTLAVSEVPATDAGNMGAVRADGGPSVPAGEPFNLEVNWNLSWTSPYWYGVIALGTDSGHPGNLGNLNVNLSADLCEGDDNGDGDMDGGDLATFADSFGDSNCPGGCAGDFNHSGVVEEADLYRLAADFGRCDCP